MKLSEQDLIAMNKRVFYASGRDMFTTKKEAMAQAKQDGESEVIKFCKKHGEWDDTEYYQVF